MKRLLLAVVLTAAASPALAGSNSCSGVIATDGKWVRIDKEMNKEPCRVKLNSRLGRRVLAKCPVGTDCTIELPIEGSDRVMARPVHGMRTIIKIDSVSRS